MTLLVRDEEAILRANIEYHLSRGVDLIIATDNRSVDGTRDILAEYERLGCLRYIYEPADDYSQDLWVTRMARMAHQEHSADWVIHADADEFWWVENHASLKVALTEVPESIDGLIVQRSNFIAPKHFDSTHHFYRELTYREVASENPLGKPLPPKICHRGRPDVFVRQGNHSFELSSGQPNMSDSSDLSIWHFPFRGFEEFRRKILQGGAAYERNERLPKSVGFTWRKLWERDKAGTLREYYETRIKSASDIEDMVRRGEAIHDPRFSQYMIQLLEEDNYYESHSEI